MKVFWMDVETGGVDEKKNPILQLAYIIEIDKKRVASGKLHSRGFKGCEIHPRALEVNGLTMEQIADFPVESELYRELQRVLSQFVNKFNKDDKYVIGGYNVAFDVGFLRELWLRQQDKYFGSWFAFQFIDPASIVRFVQYSGAMNEFARMRLVDLATYFGVVREDAHDALADIEMTINVVNQMVGLLGR